MEPRDLLDASTDAAAVVSAAGVVLGWTRGAEALLGHPASEVVGGSAARLVAMPVTRHGSPVWRSGAAPAWGGAV